MDFWEGVYRKSTNEINEVWNEENIEEYLLRTRDTERVAKVNFHRSLIDRVMGRGEDRQLVFPVNLVEHMEVLDSKG
jgi:hypothetical protein